jgi:AraC family transcriptional regulator of arabinose operon
MMNNMLMAESAIVNVGGQITTEGNTMDEIRLRDGFVGEVMYVMPRPFPQDVSNHPLIKPLMPTDIGWFPAARYHYRERPNGAPEHILIFCTEGQGWFEIDGVHEVMEPGDVLLIPRGVSHIYGAGALRPWSIHWIHFVGVIGDYYAYQRQNDTYKFRVDTNDASVLEMLFDMCRNAFVANFVLHRIIYASQALHHLLAHLMFNNRAFSPLLRSSHFRSIDDTLTYLHKNVHAKLTLDQMADYAGLSRSHFVRLFKEQTQYSPMNYFIRLKMQHACMLLSLSDKSVKEISYDVGYENPYYFSRLFKRVIGVSPSDYRDHGLD